MAPETWWPGSSRPAGLDRTDARPAGDLALSAVRWGFDGELSSSAAQGIL
ncbi:MAG: hypothetical protein MZV63_65520 [Marinilabiliales bacterium]|nr:hypothetical protein [Marinilabiliales bacterium]